MQRTLLAVAAAAFLMVGCAQTDAPHSAAPAPQPPPQAASPQTASPQTASPQTKASSDKAAPSPLLNPPGSNSRVVTGGSPEVCLQQCEHSYQICMDGTAARADVTSGTMYESRLFGPAARCETSLASCLKRCNATTAKK